MVALDIEAGPRLYASQSFVGENHRLGLDRVSGARTGVLSAAAGQTADGPDHHVMIAKNLATEPHAR